MTTRRWPVGIDLPRDRRETEYSPSHRLPDRDLSPFLDRYGADSAEARRLNQPTTHAYGDSSTTTLDLFLPPILSGREQPSDARPGPPPVHVFIHGGYWQQLSKLDSAFLAPACADTGLALAAVDYTLAPAATLDQIVDECTTALRWLRTNGESLGLDVDRMVVSGSSAGAHLAAMAALRLPRTERPFGLVLVSGVYLLEPLIGTSINDAVGLDAEAATRNSPLLQTLDGFPPAVVAFGDDESDEFKAQSRGLVDALAGAGTPVREVEVARRNHFDVVFDIVPDLTAELDRLVRPGADR
ncbi:MAG: alpha/beta hydrolase [Actinomycetota bacterium]